jgi:hypothetical protein
MALRAEGITEKKGLIAALEVLRDPKSAAP